MSEPSERDRELYSRAMSNADQIARAQLGFDPWQSITLMVMRDQECIAAIATARAEGHAEGRREAIEEFGFGTEEKARVMVLAEPGAPAVSMYAVRGILAEPAVPAADNGRPERGDRRMRVENRRKRK